MKAGSVALSVLAVTAGLLLAASCGNDAATSRQGSALTLTATDYKFDVTGEAKAGLATIDFVNKGKEPHIPLMLKLKAGKTAADVLPLLPNDGPPDAQALGQVLDESIDTFHGQPGLTLTGDSIRTITTALSPGTYALFCPIPSPDRQSHAEKGMVTQFVVKSGDSKSEVKTDGDISIEDGSFKLPSDFGNGTYRVVNNGKEPHEVTVARLEGKATVEDVDNIFNDYFGALFGEPSGPPPSVPVVPAHVVGGFIDTMPPGAVGYLVLRDPPAGRYSISSESDDSTNKTKFHTEFQVK
jgi:hypothetical protein